MRNIQDYGLLNGLFAEPIKTLKTATVEKNTKKSSATQRTWKIKDDLWDDFTTLVKMSGLTQAEYVNRLIETDIGQNRERIGKYRDMVKN